MDTKKAMKEYLKWATQNDQNRKEAINSATQMIALLNNLPKNSKLSEEDLGKIFGGLTGSSFVFLRESLTAKTLPSSMAFDIPKITR